MRLHTSVSIAVHPVALLPETAPSDVRRSTSVIMLVTECLISASKHRDHVCL
jgi:hypothetical protein